MEKIAFFHQLINCIGPVTYWNYTPDYRLIPAGIENLDIIEKAHLKKHIEKHLASGFKNPLILEIGLGILWMAGFEYRDAALIGIHLFGPVFIGKNSIEVTIQRLDDYNLPVKIRAALSRYLVRIPVIPINILANHAIMLHYTLNNEKISQNNISYAVTDSDGIGVILSDPPYNEHYGIWHHEQRLCKMFEDGDPNYRQALSASFQLSSGIRAECGDSLRKNKNNALVLLTLCSRSCLKGGLNPNIAYSLHDHYTDMIENAASSGEVSNICSALAEDFTSRVRISRQQSSITTPIQEICYYILKHLTEPEKLTIQNLSGKIGYTEYYFSHKFKKETGLSVNGFIMQEKIRQAKFLLSSTTLSIQEISDSLAFSNRSYFYSCFQKQVGVSPTEYRKQPAKHP